MLVEGKDHCGLACFDHYMLQLLRDTASSVVARPLDHILFRTQEWLEFAELLALGLKRALCYVVADNNLV